MNISKLTIFLVTLFSCQQLAAQNNNGAPVITSPVSASPNAASLGVYGETPVGLYTGLPNINIPFYEINSGGIKVPLGISYHGGGVKVEETASWVGLGWSLNAGGVITRQVRGVSDEAPNGYFYTWKLTDDYVQGRMTDIVKQGYLNDALSGSLDTQQDIYYYNIGGESGKFFLDPSGRGISIPMSKTKIEFGTFLGVESCWKITSTNGQVSYFTDKELSRSQAGTGTGMSNYSISSWYLTKISNAAGTESVDFSYENTSINFKTISSQTKYILIEGQPTALRENVTNYSVNYIDGKRLTKILFKNGQVDLIKDSQPRQDLNGDYRLQSLIIKNNDQSYYKRVDFNTSYVTSDDVATIGYPEEKLRLFLNNISVRNLGNTVADTYQFNYNLTSLPARNSFDQDHWGYFNNAHNGANFIPTTTINFPSKQFTVTSADRTVNSAYCKAGTLESIVYPLGGRTEFTYENHTADNVPAALDVPAEYLNAKILADGSSTYYETSFSITEGFGPQKGKVSAEFTIFRDGCPNITTAGCPVTLLYYPDGRVMNINGNSTLFLPIGDYRITANLTGVPANMLSAYFLNVLWAKGVSGTQQYNVPVGGLRIKEIKNYDQNNLLTGSKFYSYLVPGLTDHSSGSLLSFPNYIGEATDMTAKNLGNSNFIIYYTAHYISISSGSNMPLVSTQNSSVGYQNVQVKSDESGVMGKTETEFTFATDIYFDEFPFAPAISREYLRGLEKGSKVYRYNAATAKYELIHQKTNEYDLVKGESYTGVKVGKNVFRSNDYAPDINDIRVGQSIISTGWYPLKKETTAELDPKTNLNTQTISDYAYNEDYLKVKKVSTTNSRGLTKSSSSSYPFDMVSAGRDPQGIYAGMLGKNMIDPVIEQEETTNGKTKRQLTNYAQPYTGVFVPGSVETLNSFTGSNERRIDYLAYAPEGNLLSVSKANGPVSSYQWGYQMQYPVAEVGNASSSEFYSQNFEENADFDGNISRVNSRSHTGRYSGFISNSTTDEVVSHSNQYLTITPGKARLFTYSGWVYSEGPSAQLFLFMYRKGETNYFSYVDAVETTQTGKWVYVHKDFLVPADVTNMRMRLDNNSAGNVWYDDLRIHPADANMSTYTYDPLVGMTSSTDNKGQSTIYEYDDFQRLLRIWDHHGYLLKSNDYHYKN